MDPIIVRDFGVCAHAAESVPDIARASSLPPTVIPKVRSLRVVMLAANPCTHDSRIIRSAEAVASAGYEVFVLAPKGDAPREETRNGVTYRRLDLADLGPEASLLGLAYAHFVSWLGLPWWRLPKRELRSDFLKAALYVLAAPLKLLTFPFSFLVRVTREISTWRLGSLRLFKPLRPHARFVGVRLLRPVFRWIGRFSRNGLRRAGRLARSLRRRIGRFSRNGLRRAGRLARSLRRRIGQLIPARQRIRRTILRRLNSTFGTLSVVQRHVHLFRKDLIALCPDIIHAHDLATLPAANKAAAVTKSVVIYDAHELETERNGLRGLFNRASCRRIERKNIRKAAAVITVCDSIADHLSRTYSIARPSVVMNAPDAEVAVFDVNRPNLRSDINLSESTPLAVYVGRITIGRGIERSVLALTHWPELHFALLGNAHEPTLLAVLQLANELGVRNRLHILPPVPAFEVVSYVRAADVSVIPIQNVCLSYYYCLPNKLLESALAGVPVVASDFPELRRFMALSKAGVLMDETDPSDIARALREAYSSRSSLRLDATRLKIVQRVYGWAAQRHTLLDLYKELESGAPRVSERLPARHARATVDPIAAIR